jgi:hypothetical protein
LRALGYSLQANRKMTEGASHRDRAAQFAHINSTVAGALASGEPAISVDTKKKELVGDFKTAGREWRPTGEPVLVRTKDFKDKQLGKVNPYGVLTSLWMRLGQRRDRRRHRAVRGRVDPQLVAPPRPRALPRRHDADDHRRLRWLQWPSPAAVEDRAAGTRRRHRTSDLRLPLPPGTSKWNTIEHRLCSFIARNWRGQPLVSRQAVVSLIGATTSTTALKVYAELDENAYERGVKVSDALLATVNLHRDTFHGEWNYLIKPTT